MQWLFRIFKGLSIPLYLSQEDRERIDGLQFHAAAVLDEAQALCLELSATRQALELMVEELREINGGIEKGEGRKGRHPSGKNHQAESDGAL